LVTLRSTRIRDSAIRHEYYLAHRHAAFAEPPAGGTSKNVYPKPAG
jgi:hypothetical protein